VHRVREDAQPRDVCDGDCGEFLARGKIEEGTGRGCGYIEPRYAHTDRRGGEALARHINLRAAQPEIERLPGQQRATGACPRAARVVGCEYRTRDRGDYGLRQQ